MTIFYGNKVIRGHAAEFLKHYKTKELLIGSLSCSCCDNSSEYFEVLSENVDTIYDEGSFTMFQSYLRVWTDLQMQKMDSLMFLRVNRLFPEWCLF